LHIWTIFAIFDPGIRPILKARQTENFDTYPKPPILNRAYFIQSCVEAVAHNPSLTKTSVAPIMQLKLQHVLHVSLRTSDTSTA